MRARPEEHTRGKPRDYASFDTEAARWVDVEVRLPAAIRGEDSPAVLALASLYPYQELQEVIDMSDGFAELLGDSLDWSRRELTAPGFVRIPLPAESRSGVFILQSRFFWHEPVEVDLAENTVVQLEPQLGAWVSGRCVLPPGADARGITPDQIQLMLRGRSHHGAFPSGTRAERRQVLVREDFTFELRALPADLSYVLTAQAENLVANDATVFEVQPGEHRQLEIHFLIGATITGRALGEGRPLAGVEIVTDVLLDSRRVAFRRFMTDMDRLVSCTSGEDGAFELIAVPPGKVRLTAKKEPWFAKVEEFVVSDGEVIQGLEVNLSSGRRIAGRLLWPDGRPAVRARVSAEGTVQMGVRHALLATNEAGEFLIPGLLGDVFEVVAVARVDDEVYARFDLPPATRAGVEEWVAVESEVVAGTDDLVLTLQPPIAVEGFVVDGTGAPVPQFLIQAIREERSIHSHSSIREIESIDGSFSLDVACPGVWTFTCEADGYGRCTQKSIRVPHFGSPLLLVLRNPVRVHGTIRAGGHGLPGARLVVREGEVLDSWMESARADAQGGYELMLDRPGSHVFGVSDGSDYDLPDTRFYIDVPEATDFELDLDFPLGSMSGRVLDPNGSPVPGVLVSVCNSSRAFRFGSMKEWRSASTDRRGWFALENLPEGSYTASAMDSSNIGAAVVDGIEVRGNCATEKVEIQLLIAGSLEGVVRDESGAPVNSAAVFVRDAQGRTLPHVSCLTDVAGKFTYQGLLPGHVTATARAGDLACLDSRPVEIISGETSRLDLVVAHGSYLSVSVLKRSQPVEARLSVIDEDGRLIAELTQMQDGFGMGFSSTEARVGPLPPGKYTLLAATLAGDSAKEELVIEAGQKERSVTLRVE